MKKVIEVLKMIHIIPIDLLKRGILSKEKTDILIALFLLSMLVVLYIVIIYDAFTIVKKIIICIKTVTIQTRVVKGIVVKKNHHHHNNRVMIYRKKAYPLFGTDDFRICVKYAGQEYWFKEDVDLYQDLRKGDSVNLVFTTRKDKEGKIIEEKVELE